MKQYIQHDPWCVVENGFHAEHNEITESLMSLGNGRMGQRGNFEETYSGKTLIGNYVAGVFYPDKTRVGWWKNGYPRYFAKVLNACNWTRIDVQIDNETLDLAHCQVADFRRILNMKEGYLERSFVATLASGKQIRVHALRFCSLVEDEAAAIRYAITPLNFDGTITFAPYLDGDVSNRDSNYGEKFWTEIKKESSHGQAYLELQTKDTEFKTELFNVATAMQIDVTINGQSVDFESNAVENNKQVACQIQLKVKANDTATLHKYVVNLSSLNYAAHTLHAETQVYLERIVNKGFDQLQMEQAQAWASSWAKNDIVIEGDVAAQQGIRFNIFQLEQTYTGKDERLNIGPKGFTGEKYGGSTYWDTEAYCLPFFLATADPAVARQLLVYRHKQLQKAIENAEKLGFNNGAALYPMVTMTGEECHNEWEITFEEIHRNGAIAYAIYDYVRYTGDESYLQEYGLDVLVAIARFWAQRVNWSADKEKYVMLGVTGPNEYENNANNNFYTNYLAAWCLKYTLSNIKYQTSNIKYQTSNVQSPTSEELAHWQHIVDNMYLPFDAQRQVYLQQDGFLDKELLTVDDIAEHRPINQKWSWDRILRSCFIKQADVLQGLYFFEEDFDQSSLARHFDFYEPMTVHESSLSPCVHVILAAQLGRKEKAYEMYVRTARLDLDDYNNDTEDGCHITSMAGTWMSVIKGFAGMRVQNGQVSFQPFLPDQWQSYTFRVGFRGVWLRVAVQPHHIEIKNTSAETITVRVYDQSVTLAGGQKQTVPTEATKPF
ncbi:MAG: glycoside hydrolase family 65 protein [Runella slithyformis]|nr:MAG: glycoside hydrolase family 65 protein [Runella slithyformis]TAF29338.1 MAG: glycoside hydrolase family 65 protein [Runella slithyformis]TAF48355.1 MAG: glycoside hydrolase family 65 protein [Runella slithyformis]TAF83240.1 MAG: glycoside hydrolase family 65 protein [Runella slithyformis]